MRKLLIAGITALLCASAQADVIANQAIASNLDAELVKKIFLGKVSRVGANKTQSCMLEEKDEVLSDFYQNVLGKSASAYQAYWNRMLYSGKAVPPKTFESREELMRFVANNRGGICFISDGSGLPDGVVKVSI